MDSVPTSLTTSESPHSLAAGPANHPGCCRQWLRAPAQHRDRGTFPGQTTGSGPPDTATGAGDHCYTIRELLHVEPEYRWVGTLVRAPLSRAEGQNPGSRYLFGMSPMIISYFQVILKTSYTVCIEPQAVSLPKNRVGGVIL